MKKLLVFTAPSGAGKTTIVRYLLNQFEELAFSISATTRTQRPKEVEGQDYFFLTKEAFLQRINDGDFVEWEEVYPDKYYGTLKSEVTKLWENGKCVVFDIDVKGAQKIKALFPEQTLTVFVKPPSIEILEQRLKKRATESETSLATRLLRVRQELSCEHLFDKVLINDDLSLALQQASSITETFLNKP